MSSKTKARAPLPTQIYSLSSHQTVDAIDWNRLKPDWEIQRYPDPMNSRKDIRIVVEERLDERKDLVPEYSLGK